MVDAMSSWWDRVRTLLRELPEPGWDRIADAVVDAVRASPRPARPIDVLHSGERGSETTTISDVAVRSTLSRAIASEYAGAISTVRVAVERRRITGITTEVTGRYASDLMAVATHVRSLGAAALRWAIGTAHGGAHIDIDVVVTDVERSTPRMRPPAEQW